MHNPIYTGWTQIYSSIDAMDSMIFIIAVHVQRYTIFDHVPVLCTK